MTQRYDVIVVGAGIQGAGIAQACALNGWRVKVLERNSHPGRETSSASSKLIHGGLRYLETLQLHLVYECLAERKRLLANAPSIASLAKFYIPVYKSSRRHPLWIFAGLGLYSLLGGLTPANRFRKLNRGEWPSLPIRQEGLKAVFQYQDGQTDDLQLTEAVLRSAQRLGAELSVDAEVRALSARSQYLEVTTQSETLRTRCLINAAGPWVNEVAMLLPQTSQMPLDWVQGVHILLPRPAPIGCFYVEAPTDGRPMFVLPWRGQTLVGTTEHALSSPEASPTEEEIDYLLQAYNRYFPEHACTREAVVEVMAGVRVLPKNEKSANARHRETQLREWCEDGRLYLGVYGGKLTSYRAVAEKVSYRIASCLGVPTGAVKTTRCLAFE